MLKRAREMRHLRKNLPGLHAMRLQYAKAPSVNGVEGGLEDELLALSVDRAFLEGGDAEIRTRAAFERSLQAGLPRLVPEANAVCSLAGEVLAQYQAVRKRLANITQINWLDSVRDMQAQLDGLVYRGFLLRTPWQRLLDYPRYLRALELRIDKLRWAAERDRQWLRELAGVLEPWRERERLRRAKGVADPRLEEIRWMLEELRVSLFAQELKTAYPVSVKRVRRRWEELGL
jgi:ATP-dependent helicase HrpA